MAGMMKLRRCAWLAFWVAGWVMAVVSPGQAYVPEAPHLIAMMAKALAGPKHLRVIQQVEDKPVQALLAPQPDGLAQNSTGLAPELPEAEKQTEAVAGTVDLQPLHWNETLSFIFPDRFRKDAWIGEVNQVEIINGDNQVCITGGEIRSWKPNRSDAYIEPLLYRRRFLLQRKLAERGVDINVSSLGRWDHRLVYVIGASFPDASAVQLWIDKQNFLPLRWIFPSGTEDAAGALKTRPAFEIVYSGWKKKGPTWYPERIEFYQGRRMVRRIDVLELLPEADFSEALFDLQYLESVYGRQVVEKREDDQSMEEKDLDEVRQAIDAFHKKFKD